MKRNKIIFFLLLCCAINLSAQQRSYDLPIIPRLSYSTIHNGYFVLTSQTKINLTHFGKIPHGKATMEKDSWLFCDEIQVN